MIPVLPLLKTGSGSRQLINKQVQGNRMIYTYLNADGTRKIVTKKYDPAKARHPHEEQQKSKVVSEGENKAGVSDPKKKQVQQEERHPISVKDYTSKLLGGGIVTESNKLPSLTGIPLEWVVVKTDNIEGQYMEGKKFRLVVSNMQDKGEEGIAVDVRVYNLPQAVTVYSKRVKVPVTDSNSIIDTVSNLSFATGNDGIKQSLTDYFEGKDTSKVEGVNAVKLALEKRYFKPKPSLI
jgi:hypothetical protein